MDRRQFLTWAGVGTLASSLPVVLAACNPTTSDEAAAPSPSAATPEGFVAIGTVEQLEQDGKILNESAAAEPVLVLRHPDTQAISAVNPKCTHKDCIVEANAEQKVLVCPCHNSEFGYDGAVLKGPADRPLPTFETKEENKSILVKNDI